MVVEGFNEVVHVVALRYCSEDEERLVSAFSACVVTELKSLPGPFNFPMH